MSDTQSIIQSSNASLIEKARGAGYTDDEINNYLGPRIAAARAAGYSQDEINQYLGITPPPPFDDDKVRSGIETNLRQAAEPVTSFGDALTAGWQLSTTGLVTRGAPPTKTLAENAPWTSRIAANLAELTGDIPAMAGGFLAGGALGSETGPGAAVTATAGAFALPTALRATLMDAYEKGQFNNFQDFWGRVAPIFIDTAKSYVTGAATGAAGKAVEAVAPAYLVSPTMQHLTRDTAQIATMTTVGKALEGQVPDAQDFVDAAVTLGGLKFVEAGSAKLRDIYRQTGITPQAVLQDATRDVTIQQDLASEKAIPDRYAAALPAPETEAERPAEEPTALSAPAEAQQAPTVAEAERPLGAVQAPGETIPFTEGEPPERVPSADVVGFGAPPAPPEGPPPVAGPEPAPGAPDSLADAQKRILSHMSIGEEPTGRGWTWSRLNSAVLDRLFPIEQAVTRLVGKNVLPIAEDAGKLARLLSGANGIADRFLNYNTLDFATRQPNGASLKDILEPVKDDMDRLRAFAASARAMELDSRGIETGFDLDAAQRVVFDPENRELAQHLQNLIDYQNRVSAYLRDAGVISQDGYNAMLEANKLYVPFQRVMEILSGQGGGPGRTMQPQDPIHAIIGSQRMVVDPIETIIRNTYQFSLMAERNVVATKLIDMLLPHGEAEKSTTPPPPRIDLDALRAAGVDTDPLEAILQAARPVSGAEVRVFRNGTAETYRVDPELARAVKGLDQQNVEFLEKLLRPFASTLRAGAVLQLPFMVRHTIRDFLYAVVTYPGFFHPGDMARAFLSMATRDPAYQEWLSSGGANVSMVSFDRRYLQNSIDDLTGTGLLERAWNVVQNPAASTFEKAKALGMTLPANMVSKYLLRPLQAGVQFAESATHIGAFIKSREEMLAQNAGQPLTKEQVLEAGYRSRDVAVDAARMGAKMRTWNALSAFSNITLQDTARVARAFVESPMSTAIKVAAVISLPSALVWMNGHGDPRYDDAPDWEKDLFWVIPTDRWQDATAEEAAGLPSQLVRQLENGQLQVNNGTTLRIPKPWGMGIVFGSLLERSLDGIAGRGPDAFNHFMKSVGEVSLPSILPNAFVPIIEQFANRSIFTNRTLVPDQMEKGLPEYQYTPYTTETAKALGQLLGAFPGVRNEAITPGALGGGVARALTSPILLENYLRAWTGNLGMDALYLADYGLRKAGVVPDPPNQPTSTLADIPFVKAFVVRYPTSSAQSIQDFSDAYTANKVYFDTWQRMSREGNMDAVQRIQALGGPTMFVQLDGMYRAIQEQNKLIRDIYKNPEIPSDEKRQLIDTTYWRMSELAAMGNTMIRQARETLIPQQ